MLLNNSHRNVHGKAVDGDDNRQSVMWSALPQFLVVNYVNWPETVHLMHAQSVTNDLVCIRIIWMQLQGQTSPHPGRIIDREGWARQWPSKLTIMGQHWDSKKIQDWPSRRGNEISQEFVSRRIALQGGAKSAAIDHSAEKKTLYYRTCSSHTMVQY